MDLNFKPLDGRSRTWFDLDSGFDNEQDDIGSQQCHKPQAHVFDATLNF